MRIIQTTLLRGVLVCAVVMIPLTPRSVLAGENIAIIHYISAISEPGQTWAGLLEGAGYTVTLLPATGPTDLLDAYDVVIDLSYEWSDPDHLLAGVMSPGRGVITYSGTPYILGVDSDPIVQAYIGAANYANDGSYLVTTAADPILGNCEPGLVLNGPCSPAWCAALTALGPDAIELGQWTGHGYTGFLKNTWQGGRSVFLDLPPYHLPGSSILLNAVRWICGPPNLAKNADFAVDLNSWICEDISQPSSACDTPTITCTPVAGTAELRATYAYGKATLSQRFSRIIPSRLAFTYDYQSGDCSGARVFLFAGAEMILHFSASCDTSVPSNSILRLQLPGQGEVILVTGVCARTGSVDIEFDYPANEVRVFVDSDQGLFQGAVPLSAATILCADEVRLFTDNSCCDGRNEAIIRFDDVWLEGKRLGDMNCDGTVDGLDIQPFVPALTAPAAYAQDYCYCDISLADVNSDGSINAFDVVPFVSLLIQ